MLLSIIVVSIYVGSPKKLLVVALSAPMATLFALGQLDGVLLLGLMLPAEWGLPLLVAKPQGVFLAIFRRINRRSLIAIVLIIALSILIWGLWWQNIIGYQPNQEPNISLFPYSILAGIFLLYFGIKRDSDALLCFASLCFMPYFMITSALPAIAALTRETEDWRLWAAVVVGSWIYLAAMRGFLG
jgi:predicted neutral ceramidase superfamily lipid hydrolase